MGYNKVCIVLLLFVFLGCIDKNKSVNKEFSIGSEINTEVLKRASQMFKVRDGFVINVNISSDTYYPEYYLLFYGQRGILKDITYLESFEVDSVKSNRIYFNSVSRLERKLSKKDRFLNKYELVNVERDYRVSTSKRFCNKVITNINLNMGLDSLEFVVKESDNLFEGLQALDLQNGLDEKNYINEKKYKYPLIVCEFEAMTNDYILIKYRRGNEYIRDYFLMKDNKTIESLYSQILLGILK